jgi:hypothetical protein
VIKKNVSYLPYLGYAFGICGLFDNMTFGNGLLGVLIMGGVYLLLLLPYGVVVSYLADQL